MVRCCKISKVYLTILGHYALTLSWRRSLLYRNQSIDLHCKSMEWFSMEWFLYNRDLRHERIKGLIHDLPAELNVKCPTLQLPRTKLSLIFQLQPISNIASSHDRIITGHSNASIKPNNYIGSVSTIFKRIFINF